MRSPGEDGPRRFRAALRPLGERSMTTPSYSWTPASSRMTGTFTSHTALRRRSGIAADYARRPRFPLARSGRGNARLRPRIEVLIPAELRQVLARNVGGRAFESAHGRTSGT